MSKNEEDQLQSALGREIGQRMERAYKVLETLDSCRPGVSGDVKKDAGVILNSYRRVLKRYRNERALDVAWEEREVNVDLLGRYMSEVVMKQKPLPRRGDATESEPALAITQMPTEQLIRIGEELHDIAKELGFAKQAKSPTPNTEASRDDLAGLLKARGQDQALENLPSAWKGEE